MTQCLAGLDLEFAYQGRDVLRGVSVAVLRGEVTALVGPSGSGKTTLLWLLAGLLEPKSGRVVLGETPEQAAAHGRPADFRTLRLGMVFQASALWEHLSVEEHLRLVLTGTGLDRAARRRRVEETLARLRLEALRRRRPGEISGGERRRLAIARALVADPDWLLLDEPLVHLDGPAREELFGVLRDALGPPPAAGAPPHAGVLLATHHAAEALRLAQQVVVLVDGAVAQAGPPQEVYRRPVNLAAARMLGPASELAGEAAAGALVCNGMAILENLPPEAAGPQRLILRPEDVTFRPDPAGPATVRRCELCGGAHLVTVDAGSSDVLTYHIQSIAPGARGRLALIRTRDPFGGPL